ncbi:MULTISPECIES: 4-hydroxy-3-methylbut-2-enyl diphosphate reductase [unclassified Sporolactobacillus]|uniref:4-hydroxy-3-methylbut-2-enyl diphosphate reductase n=1 Tax=unclassified Sporolactobacillus TaxID=2628533 RepID=UPI00236856A7|nr:4-hydroxy-3-methylbut-2-enyl diphosphate reductase [Sporolactobacillus sp. CQH2019]MDD9147573.1 4-hydroxy-3-methylbut-2-enyl diphosphate reductase [Sporolactobacillus sp. CQH2019]
MKVIKVSPRGYCYGVVDALVIAKKAAMNEALPKPIYILGMIVHNHHVTEAVKEEGIITLDRPGKKRIDLLQEIDHGTVIFTAHGVSPEVRILAEKKGLTTIDATCPDVTKTHDLIERKKKEGYHVIYIGKKGHPEPEGAIGVAPDSVHLVETVEDLDKLNLDAEKIIITNQTTMSQWDVREIMNDIKKKYPQAETANEICQATQTRQEAVATQAKEADLLIVVGDPRSNNSNRLAQVSEEIAHTPAHRIADLSELQLSWLKGVKKVAVTAGASTPTQLTKEVILFLDQYNPDNPETWSTESKAARNKNILPKVKADHIRHRKEPREA